MAEIALDLVSGQVTKGFQTALGAALQRTASEYGGRDCRRHYRINSTFRVAILPQATTAPSPMVASEMLVQPEQSQTSLSISTLPLVPL